MLTPEVISSLLALLLFGPSTVSVDLNTAKKALNASVLLRIKSYPDAEGKRSMGGCSGTYITPTKILTAAHCLNAPIEFIWARGTKNKVGYPVRVIRKSPSQDLALLEAPYPHAYVRLGPAPKVGHSILNVGSPFNFEFVVSEGIVGALGYRVRGLKARYTVTTAMINSGSSGGGAFNTKGELIGVNTMTAGGPFGWAGISLAVSREDIQRFLNVEPKIVP